MLSDYHEQTILGQGSFGQVIRVKRAADKKVYCIKRVPLTGLSTVEYGEAMNEVQVLSRCRYGFAGGHGPPLLHPNIIAYVDSFIERGSLNIVMNYADSGDLGDYIKRRATATPPQHPPEEIVWDVLTQLAQGLVYLHGIQILHRDLKPKNVFLNVGSSTAAPARATAATTVTPDTHATSIPSTTATAAEAASPSHAITTPTTTTANTTINAPILPGAPLPLHISPSAAGAGAAARTSYLLGDLGFAELEVKIATTHPPPLPPTYSIELVTLVNNLMHKDPGHRPTAAQVLVYPATVVRSELARLRKREAVLAAELHAAQQHGARNAAKVAETAAAEAVANIEARYKRQRETQRKLVDEVLHTAKVQEARLRDWASQLLGHEHRLVRRGQELDAKQKKLHEDVNQGQAKATTASADATGAGVVGIVNSAAPDVVGIAAAPRCNVGERDENGGATRCSNSVPESRSKHSPETTPPPTTTTPSTTTPTPTTPVSNVGTTVGAAAHAGRGPSNAAVGLETQHLHPHPHGHQWRGHDHQTKPNQTPPRIDPRQLFRDITTAAATGNGVGSTVGVGVARNAIPANNVGGVTNIQLLNLGEHEPSLSPSPSPSPPPPPTPTPPPQQHVRETAATAATAAVQLHAATTSPIHRPPPPPSPSEAVLLSPPTSPTAACDTAPYTPTFIPAPAELGQPYTPGGVFVSATEMRGRSERGDAAKGMTVRSHLPTAIVAPSPPPSSSGAARMLRVPVTLPLKSQRSAGIIAGGESSSSFSSGYGRKLTMTSPLAEAALLLDVSALSTVNVGDTKQARRTMQRFGVWAASSEHDGSQSELLQRLGVIVIEDAALFDGLPVLVVLAWLMAAELKGFNLRREHAAWVLDLVVRAAAACPHRDISGTQHKGWTSPKSQRRYR
eukprot:gene11134-28758_t